jgi:polyisoprenoid-binding protein YceI
MNTTTATATDTTTWTVDHAHTEVGFAVKHLMISTVRGRFGAVEGTVVVNEADPSNSKLDITDDVTSVDTRQQMRDDHLRSADFFDVANHPKMHFVSKKITGDINDEFKVVGDLTIRGNTRETTLDVTMTGRGNDPWGSERAGFEAKGKVSRGEFGLLYNQVLETGGGVVVGDEVKISIDVELVKQKADA